MRRRQIHRRHPAPVELAGLVRVVGLPPARGAETPPRVGVEPGDAVQVVAVRGGEVEEFGGELAGDAVVAGVGGVGLGAGRGD